MMNSFRIESHPGSASSATVVMWKGLKGVFLTAPPSALIVVQLGIRPSVLFTLQQVHPCMNRS